MAKVKKVVSVSLELNEEEADALMTLLGNNVTGSGKTRELLDAIWDALDGAGMRSLPNKYNIAGFANCEPK